MVVNNWYVLMEAYAYLTSDWSRLYFMTFYIMTLVVITIVVALVLETFLFRIQYRHKMGDIDSKFQFFFHFIVILVFLCLFYSRRHSNHS